jgi:hypothetical protein
MRTLTKKQITDLARMKKLSPDGKVLRLAPLDIVRTCHHTLCVVNSVSSTGSVSLVLPAGSKQKVAWYDAEELSYVGCVRTIWITP